MLLVYLINGETSRHKVGGMGDGGVGNSPPRGAATDLNHKQDEE